MLKSKLLLVSILTLIAAALIFVFPGIKNSTARTIQVYHSKSCGCCLKWVEHLKSNGFKVETLATDDMNRVKVERGVSGELASCHTAVIDGYVLEGHVPVAAIEKLLKEKPSIKGLAVPGMPMGSPGMEASYNETYDVIAFKEREKKIYMTFKGSVAH